MTHVAGQLSKLAAPSRFEGKPGNGPRALASRRRHVDRAETGMRVDDAQTD